MEQQNMEPCTPCIYKFGIQHDIRSGVRHTNILLRGPILLTFGINYFTYGFSEPKGWSEPLDFLTCSFLLEFPLCESLCIWTSCVCSLYSIFFRETIRD
ncbi:hypothetical protein V6Z12_A10G229400 [Gossypium hirsutum]